MTSSLEKRKRVAELIRKDHHAPLYHFIAPEGICMPFDPNGALFWKGRYHLFYIFQDPTLPHAGHCWGHASSTDLLHWTFHPTALAPAAGDPEIGIFSGGALVNKEGVPTIMYFGIGAGICMATAEDDDLVHWQKSPHNPVIREPKPGERDYEKYHVHDPGVWLDGDTYCALVNRRNPDGDGDMAVSFTSPDLLHWEYTGPFYQSDRRWTDADEDCACPDFFALGDRHMLLCISHARGARYYLGRYQAGTFVPQEHHRMNWPGGSCFAPESLLDDSGRRIFWAWVMDQREGNSNGLGVLTMPRLLALDDAGSLLIDPPAELESLRCNPRGRTSLTLEEGEQVRLAGIEGDVMELAVQASLPESGLLVVKVRLSHDEEEETLITVDMLTSTLSIDTTRASLDPRVFQRYPICGEPNPDDVRVQTAPFALRPGEPLRLRVFLDKSMLEVYANRRQCVTQRIYPTRADSLGVAVVSKGGGETTLSIDAWDMTATNTA